MSRRPTFLLALWLGVATTPAISQVPLTDNQARASFVLHFARYIEWPGTSFASRDAPLVICMLGNDSRGLSLAEVGGRRIGDHPVETRKVERAASTDGCHVVYLADSEERRLAGSLQILSTRPVLTVSDIDGFIDAGGMIGLLRTSERLQFEINRDALQVAGLRASANLLRLARNLAQGR